MVIWLRFKNQANGIPKIAISTPSRDSSTPAIIDHGHNLAIILRLSSEIFVRHQCNGWFILVATRLAMNPLVKGGEPPPTRNNAIQRRKKIRAPNFLSMKTRDQITIRNPTIIARIPVMNKFGIIVKAGSLAPGQNS